MVRVTDEQVRFDDAELRRLASRPGDDLGYERKLAAALLDCRARLREVEAERCEAVETLARACLERDRVIAAHVERETELIVERDEARALARILAHSYQADSRPPDRVVAAALAYPVFAAATGAKP